MIVETEKMINMTKYIFKELEQKKVLNFKNLEMDAMSFAFTIHGLMDHEKDCKKIKNANNQNLKIRNKIIIIFRENEKKSKFRNNLIILFRENKKNQNFEIEILILKINYDIIKAKDEL